MMSLFITLLALRATIVVVPRDDTLIAMFSFCADAEAPYAGCARPDAIY